MRSIFQDRRSRSRSRPKERIPAADYGSGLVQRDQKGEGDVQLRKQPKASKRLLVSTLGNEFLAVKNSVDLELRGTSSRNASRTSVSTLIDKEMSKAMEMKRSSPSLVARLMGLDALPLALPKQQKEGGSNYQNSSVRFPKNYGVYEGYPLHTSTNEYEECKDVFEVKEMPKTQNKKIEAFPHGMSRLKQSDLRYIIDAENPSSDDEVEYSKEYDDVMEDLNPNKDHFLNFLDEPNSLFKKHLLDLKCDPPPSHASHITVLKPTKATTLANEFSFKSERNSHKSHQPLYRGEINDQLHHTQIVLLKPSMEKALDMASSDDYHHGLRKQKHPISRRAGAHFEVRNRHDLSDNMEAMENKTKGLREIAREITKQLRTGGSSSSKMGSASDKYSYSGESSCDIKGNLNLELFPGMPNHFNDYSDSFSASSYYSTESSVSREARKRLSERWKMAHHIQEMEIVHRGSSTLGEMLVFDRDRPRSSRNTSRTVSIQKQGKDEVLARWEDGWSRSLARSKSLPSSSIAFERHKPSGRNNFGCSSSTCHLNEAHKSENDSLSGSGHQKRKPSIQSLKNQCTGEKFFSGREEDELSVREIHVNSEELSSKINVRHLDEERFMNSEAYTESITTTEHDHGNLAPQCKYNKFSHIIDAQQVEQFTKFAEVADGGEGSCIDEKDIVRKELSIDHRQFLTHCEILELQSPISSKEADQPSPVSVLEPTQDQSSSESFEKISADLKELRMQLKLLKRQSADSDTGDLELHFSSDDDNEDSHSPGTLSHILDSFRDNEDRDYSYVLDVLIESGVRGTNADELVSDFSVGISVFEKLEKKYNLLVSWTRPERKLLFDLTSSILGSLFSLPTDQFSAKSKMHRPSFAHESLVEEVWQTVVKQRKELSGKLDEGLLLDRRWLDLGDLYMIGTEIESLIIEDFMEELFA